jgi:hypothetical protein
MRVRPFQPWKGPGLRPGVAAVREGRQVEREGAAVV